MSESEVQHDYGEKCAICKHESFICEDNLHRCCSYYREKTNLSFVPLAYCQKCGLPTEGEYLEMCNCDSESQGGVKA